MSDTLVDKFLAHVRSRGEKIFTRHLSAEGETPLTFEQFLERATAFAHTYLEANIKVGDVVLIFLPTSPDALPAFVGAMLIGAVPSFMPCPSEKQDPGVYWHSHQALIRRIGTLFILTDAAHAHQMKLNGVETGEVRIVTVENLSVSTAKLPRFSIDPDQTAFLQHSSGTTSLKKGVALTHRAVLAQAQSYGDFLQASDTDNVVSWLPIYHDMGLIACSILPLVLGQTVTILDPFHWVARPSLLFEALQNYDGHLCWLPNFAFEHLTRTVPQSCTADLSKVRAFINCSEPCKPDTFNRFAQRFATLGVRPAQLQVCYAMAETVFAVSQTRLNATTTTIEVDGDILRLEKKAVEPRSKGSTVRLLSAGPPIPEIEVEIMEGGDCLGTDQVGEIVVSGPFLFDGYYNDAKTTAERLVGGQYYTRDLGFVRDGELFVLGRKDDLLIINGRNLYAHEVEALAADIAGLKAGRTVAFGVYSERVASEELIIVAELDVAAVTDNQTIVREVRTAVFDHTGIDVNQVHLVELGWLVKTTSGKISREQNRKKWLAEIATEGQSNAVPVAAGSTSDTFDVIRRIISQMFHVRTNRITERTIAADIRGWDSLAHATVVLEIEQAFSIKFADDEVFGFASVGDLVARTAELCTKGENGRGASRVVYESDDVSIVCYGEQGDNPDLIIFAGMRRKFGGRNLMDFASTLSSSDAKTWRKFFVTDRRGTYYPTAQDEIAPAINQRCSGPKIVVGNSMGGYGALKTASYLEQLRGVLAFVPRGASSKGPRRTGLPAAHWEVAPVGNVPYSILFGEVQDAPDKQWIRQTFVDPENHMIHIVPNVGHRLVGYLDSKGLLAKVLECGLDPATMNERVRSIVASIEPSPHELRTEVNKLGERERREAWADICEKEEDESRLCSLETIQVLKDDKGYQIIGGAAENPWTIPVSENQTAALLRDLKVAISVIRTQAGATAR